MTSTKFAMFKADSSLRRQAQGDQRARRLGTRPPHRPRDARRQTLCAGSRNGDALSRVLCAAELGARNAPAGARGQPHLLSADRLGQRQGHADLFAPRTRRQRPAAVTLPPVAVTLRRPRAAWPRRLADHNFSLNS